MLTGGLAKPRYTFLTYQRRTKTHVEPVSCSVLTLYLSYFNLSTHCCFTLDEHLSLIMGLLNDYSIVSAVAVLVVLWFGGRVVKVLNERRRYLKLVSCKLIVLCTCEQYCFPRSILANIIRLC